MTESRPVALVTGAARRVGAVIARRLHAAGFDLVLHHRDSGVAIAALVAELESTRTGSTQVIALELGRIDQLGGLIAAARDRFGRLDALVNNASTFFPTPIATADEQQWNALFDVNAKAPFFLSQAAAPLLRATRGSIVNLVDIYAERPLRAHPIYCMAKAALVMMTQSLARELGPEVRVNAVAPGAVLWPESGKPYTDQAALIANTALKRAGSPEDVAEAVRWLICDARFTTGQVVRVDGGRSY